MEFGIGVATAADSWKTVRRAEELGFHTAWFEDSQMVVADPFVAMAASAMQTSTIRLATGIAVPSNRIAPVSANMLASLNRLAPGRIDWGVGTGFSARRAMGLPAVKVDVLREHVRQVRGLIEGETVDIGIEGKRRKIRFLNPERELFDVTTPIGFHVAAGGPRMRELTASLDCHWINAYVTLEQARADIAAMDVAYTAAGRDPAAYRKTAYAFGGCLRDGETCGSPRVRDQAGPLAAVVLHNLIETHFGDLGTGGIDDPVLLDAYRELYESYEPDDARYLSLHRGHALFLREDEKPLITDEFIRNTSFTGTVDELADAVKGIRDAGYTGVSFMVLPHMTDAVEDWARVMERI